MRVIFCDSVVDNKMVEPDYEGEFQAAKSAGFSTSVFRNYQITIFRRPLDIFVILNLMNCPFTEDGC